MILKRWLFVIWMIFLLILQTIFITVFPIIGTVLGLAIFLIPITAEFWNSILADYHKIKRPELWTNWVARQALADNFNNKSLSADDLVWYLFDKKPETFNYKEKMLLDILDRIQNSQEKKKND